MLTSAVKRRELIDFTKKNVSESAYTRVTYSYALLLGPKRNY